MDRIATKHMAKSSWRDWFSKSKKKESIIDTTKKKTMPMSPDTMKKASTIEKENTIEKLVDKELAKDPEKEPEKVLEEIPKPADKSLGDLDEKIVEIGNYSIREEDVEKQEYRLTHAKGVSKIGSDVESVTSTGSVKKVRVRRTLRPTSDMLKALNLKPGCNPVIYTVISRGEQKVYGFIYFWPSNANIVISDVDGTITKYFLFLNL